MKAEGLLQKANIQTALWLPWDVVGACSLYPQVNIPKGMDGSFLFIKKTSPNIPPVNAGGIFCFREKTTRCG